MSNKNVWAVVCYQPGDGVGPLVGIYTTKARAQTVADKMEEYAIENDEVLDTFDVEEYTIEV